MENDRRGPNRGSQWNDPRCHSPHGDFDHHSEMGHREENHCEQGGMDHRQGPPRMNHPGESEPARMRQQMERLTDEAVNEVIKERAKAKILEKIGDELDPLIDLVVDEAIRNYKSKLGIGSDAQRYEAKFNRLLFDNDKENEK